MTWTFSARVAYPAFDELRRLCHYDALFGSPRHRDPPATAELEEPFIPKDPEGAEHRVGVHAQDGCEVSGRRQPVTWVSFPVGDRSADLGRHLLVKWQTL